MTIPPGLPAWAKKIAERCEAATKGPFEFIRDGDYIAVVPVLEDHKDNHESNDADWELFAHSRTDVPRLLAALAGTCRALRDVMDAHWDMSPLEYAKSRGLEFMSDAEGERIQQRAREVLAAVEKGGGDGR